MLKRFLLVAIALLMVAMAFAGCAQDAQDDTADTVSEDTADTGDADAGDADAGDADADTGDATDEVGEPPAKKVGVIIWATDDQLSASSKRLLDYAGEALNIELVYKTGDFDTESQVKAAENFVAAGVDGILCVPLFEAGIPKIYQVCADAGIPYVQMFRDITLPDVAAQMADAELFLGWAVEDEITAGQKMLELFAADGVKNVAAIYAQPGQAVTDKRQAGFDIAFDQGIANLIADPYVLPLSVDSSYWIEATNSFISTYPELDGILMVSGAVGGAEGTIATIENNNAVGKVKMATFDQPANANEAFEKGILSVCGTGMFTDPLYAFMIMANYLQGNPLLEDGRVEINTNYIWLTSLEDSEAFAAIDKEGVYVYTPEEIQNMTKWYNPDFTAEDLQNIASDWSLANVTERLGK